jgi:Right handed beta helix region
MAPGVTAERPQQDAKIIRLAEVRREKGLSSPLEVTLSALSVSARSAEFGLATKASDPELIERIVLALRDIDFAQGGDNRSHELGQIESMCGRVCKWKQFENFKVFYNVSLILNCVEIEAVYPVTETPPPSEPEQAHRPNHKNTYRDPIDNKRRPKNGPLRVGLGMIAAFFAVGFIWLFLSASLLSELGVEKGSFVAHINLQQKIWMLGAFLADFRGSQWTVPEAQSARRAPFRRRTAIRPAPSTAGYVAHRTWVSGIGDDANPCSQTSPCKTFAGAISKTAPGGEIECLDAGVFGSLTISKSITIDCHDLASSVIVSGPNGIVINSDDTLARVVYLRGFTVRDVSGIGLNGIRIIGNSTSKTKIILEDINILGFSQGISDMRGGGGQLVASNITVQENSGAGIAVAPSGAVPIGATLNNVKVLSSKMVGLSVQGGSSVVISNSIFSGNEVGIDVQGAGTRALVQSSFIADNRAGGFVVGGSLRFSNSFATDVAGIVRPVIDRLFSAKDANGTTVLIGGPIHTFSAPRN